MGHYRAALEAVETIRAAQCRVRAEPNLSEAANVKFQLSDHLGHVLTWRLYPRVGRPRHHIYQQMSLAEAEAARQGRMPIVEPIDDDQAAALRELINTTLPPAAEPEPEPHTEH